MLYESFSTWSLAAISTGTPLVLIELSIFQAVFALCNRHHGAFPLQKLSVISSCQEVVSLVVLPMSDFLFSLRFGRRCPLFVLGYLPGFQIEQSRTALIFLWQHQQYGAFSQLNPIHRFF